MIKSNLTIATLVLAALICLASCTKKNQDSISGDDPLTKAMAFAKKTLGGNKVDVSCNTDCTYFLATEDSNGEITYCVTDMQQKVVIPAKKILGSVDWHDTHHIEVIERPRVLQDKTTTVAAQKKIISVTQIQR